MTSPALPLLLLTLLAPCQAADAAEGLVGTDASAEGAVATSAADPAPPLVSGEVGVDVASAYVFRGSIDDADGFVVQPWAEVAFGVFAAEAGVLRSFDVTAILFASLHSTDVGATRSPEFLYEIEPRVALSLGFAHDISVALHYALDTSPSGAFDPIHRLQLHSSVRFGPGGFGEEDGSWWVEPSLEVAVPFATGEAPYLYTGVATEIGYTLWQDGTHVLTATVPLELGFTVVGQDEGGLGDPTLPRYRFSRTGLTVAIEAEHEAGTVTGNVGFEVHHVSGLLRRGLDLPRAVQVVARAGVGFGF